MDPFSISIIIPVYHEQALINSTITNIRTCVSGGNECEMIVVDGDKNGTTIAQINDDSVITAISTRGRACQMNNGAKIASGDVLLFLHVDTTLPRDGLSAIWSLFTGDQSASAGAFSLTIDDPHPFLRLASCVTNLRCRLFTNPYGDQAIFIRRNLFIECGGFIDIPLLEDVDIIHRIKKNGNRIVMLKQKVSTSSRRWHRDGIFIRTLRNRWIMLLYNLGISPERLFRFYK